MNLDDVQAIATENYEELRLHRDSLIRVIQSLMQTRENLRILFHSSHQKVRHRSSDSLFDALSEAIELHLIAARSCENVASVIAEWCDNPERRQGAI